MFWTRVLSAIVFGAIVVFIIFKGQLWGLFALVSFIIILGCIEFSNIANSKVDLPLTLISVIIALLICFLALKPSWINVKLVLCLAVSLPFLVEIIRRKPQSALLKVSSTLLGIIYLGWLFGHHIILLRKMQDGIALVILLSGITWIGDIGAYLVGKRFGKHKVIPAISPGKSLEGYIGGIVLSCLAAFLIGRWLLPEIALVHIIIMGAGLTIIGQIGDLAESMLKRGADLKDSGSIIPGHGGILDRCDSLIFITPAFYYYTIYILHMS
ncbi:phosphatidate cytidylyltransferase [Candidatus Poribacteria bacterium]|nr:phosphatidate cytidylyltransferase [Candidatus Poribacteria bacterium]